MPNILVRGLSDAAVARLDAEAEALGLSRNELLRRRLEGGGETPAVATLTDEDWARSAEVFQDLANPEIMDQAWR